MMGSMMRRAMLGDGSTLTLDFTTGSLDPRLTFTRASTTATYINSSGYVTTAGTNVARFDHDPTTLAPRGLLVEGTSTNLLNWSESFATSGGTNNNWADTSITRTTGQADPANGTTAIRFTASAGNATVISSAAIGTSAERTFSVWLRRVTGTGNIQYTQNNGTNWTTQAITATWTRYTFTHTVDHRVGIRIVTSGDAIEMWGAMLEVGSGQSSYIATGASQATRNADECSMTGTNFSSWYTQSQGTLLVAGRTSARYVDSAGFDFPAILTVDSNNHIGAAVWNGVAYGIVRAGGAFRLNYATLATVNNNSAFKTAIAFANADFAGVANNGSPVTASSGSPPTTLNTLALGSNRAGTGNAYFGHVSIVKFWPTRLTNAQLQSLTT
jgi:hypothetical protein